LGGGGGGGGMETRVSKSAAAFAYIEEAEGVDCWI